MMIDARMASEQTCRSRDGSVKRSYWCREEAELAMLRTTRQYAHLRAHLHVYACELHGWHVGHHGKQGP